MNKNPDIFRGTQLFSHKNNEALFYFNKIKVLNNQVRRIPSLLICNLVTNTSEVVKLDTIKRKCPQEVLLIISKYELAQEISCAIGDPYDISLKQEWVDKFISGQIRDEDLEPTHLIKSIHGHLKNLVHLPKNVYHILSLWVYGTYFYSQFFYCPSLLIVGDNIDNKAELAKILKLFSLNGKYVRGIKAKDLLKLINHEGGTFIFDNPNTSKYTKRILLKILGNGHFSFSSYLGYYIYSPKVILNAPLYEQAARDNSIQISVSPETYSNSNYYEENQDKFSELSSLCCLSAMKHFQQLYEIYWGLPKSTNELYHPLVAIGKLVGGDYEKAFDDFYSVYQVV